jgi:MFS family permease
MESNLRPLTLGEILDRTAQLYRTNFLLFAGIFAAYAGVVMVLNLAQIGLTSWLHGMHTNVWLQALLVLAFLVKALLVFLFAGAAMAAINRAVAWVHLGEPATIRAAYSTTLPRLGRYLWLMTIVAFIIWAPLLVVSVVAGVVVALVPGIFTPQTGPASAQSMAIFGIVGAVVVLLIVPWIVYAIVMALRYSLAVPACVVENLKARKAIRRSVELSKGSRGRIFMLGLLVFVIELGLVGISQAFLFVLAFKHHGQLGPVAQAISQIIAFFTNTFLGPIYATGITLFYYDQRIRKEGYDIEWMMQAAGLTPPETQPETPPELPAQTEPWPAVDPTPEPPQEPPREPGSVHE